MDLLWLLPPIVLLAGAVPAGVWAARAAAEMAALRGDLARWSSVTPDVGGVRDDARLLGRRLGELRRR